MTEKFQDKYRVSSARLKNWDYGKNGAYFITICTQNKDHLFGDIVGENTEALFNPNELGALANFFWLEIIKQFPFVELGNFVIMPNHIHGIIIIKKSTDIKGITVQDQSLFSGVIAENNNPMMQDNVSRIIRWYKGRCAYEMRKLNHVFAWQSRFHEHIIRNTESFENIQNYIVNNPQNWLDDKYFK